MTSRHEVSRKRKIKKGKSVLVVKPEDTTKPPEHDHTDGRYYSDCPGCEPEFMRKTRGDT